MNLYADSTISRRRQWHPTPVLLPGKSHGWKSLVGCSPWGCKESDTTERLRFHFSLSCTGEGNGNPLQCSCLENPRDGGAWWAAVYGVAQSRTWLKQLSSSSSLPYQGTSPNQTLFLQNGVSHTCFIDWQGDHTTLSEKSWAQCVHMVGVATNTLIKCFCFCCL